MSTHGFTLLDEREIPEINTVARLYRHEQTGAQLLSLLNDDENKVFGITFRTAAHGFEGPAPHHGARGARRLAEVSGERAFC